MKSTFTDVTRDPRGGWEARAGFTGYQPYRKWCFTRWGAHLAARRIARRLRAEESREAAAGT
jgi:hypothetical protein